MSETVEASPPGRAALSVPPRSAMPTGRRQRRPSGAPPPLPRKIGTSGKLWLVLATIAVMGLLALPIVGQPGPAARFETSVLRVIANLRTEWLSDVLEPLNRVLSRWAPTVLAWATLLALVGFRRWRHLFTFAGSFAILAILGGQVYENVARPRPYGVTIIGDWGGFSMPSPPVAALSAILVGMAYSLVVPGRPRAWAKYAITAIIGLFVFTRLYLAVDHPSDDIYAVVLGVAIPLLGFRLFTPNEVFPVAYRRGKKAHLDVTGERGKAIRQAIEDQLGLTVLDVKPVGLAGSAGSTPLRLHVQGATEAYVFAKLYAKGHLRADRWYKVGRTILYGALEDEAPFQTVRRLVEYEDYTLRVMRDAGIPTAAPHGIVEITPEREYMLVTEFLDGALEIGEADVDDAVIDDGVALIRRLWDAGLAHRDIKPANLLVRDSRVYLIDAFFVQVRPSPWRQAVDLANMLLVLAVRSDPERVYERALQVFTPEEIAEAFAATRGVASPTQLRAAVKHDGRDLLERFRALAPPCRPIAIQRWNVKRIALTLAVVLGFMLAVSEAIALLAPVQEIPIGQAPECGTGSTVLLMAQAVPSASAVPCIASLPPAWKFDDANIRNDRARFSLHSDEGEGQVVVTLTAECDLTGAREISAEVPGITTYEVPRDGGAGLRVTHLAVLAGGCARYDVYGTPGASTSSLATAEDALGFTTRATLVRHVEQDDGLVLCGRDATCPSASAAPAG